MHKKQFTFIHTLCLSLELTFTCCSFLLVNISSLELMVAQFEEQADRLKHEHMLQTEQATENELIEREKLLEQLSQLMQDKETVTDKVSFKDNKRCMCYVTSYSC